MFQSSAGVAVGMASAVASMAAGVLILVGPYVHVLAALFLVVVAVVPLLALWRSLAAEEAALLGPGAPHRTRDGISRPR